MHIALISADDEIWGSGLRSISSALREAGQRTTMIFAGATGAKISHSVLKEIVSITEDAQIVGISSMSRGSARAKTLLEGLRQSGKLLVWGGIYPSLDGTAHRFYAEDTHTSAYK